MSNAGFYRIDPSGELLYAANGIATPTGNYVSDEHAGYAYPIDGAWRWFDSDTSALAMLVPAHAAPVGSVSKAQAVVALYLTPSPNAGQTLLDEVNVAVAASNGVLSLWWQYAHVIDRASANVASVASALGLSAEQVDALFALAAQQQG